MTWIVLSTRSGCEHLAAHEARRLGYTPYLPLSSEPPKFEPKPFFPGYLFVDIDPQEGIWTPLKGAKGVNAVLTTGQAPSRVPERVIELMRRREEGGVITLRRKRAVVNFKQGEPVRVHEGGFIGFEGVFEQQRAGDRIAILLNIFGRMTPVEVSHGQVAKLHLAGEP
jgi:transcriptional antiterminator RfaH